MQHISRRLARVANSYDFFVAASDAVILSHLTSFSWLVGIPEPWWKLVRHLLLYYKVIPHMPVLEQQLTWCCCFGSVDWSLTDHHTRLNDLKSLQGSESDDTCTFWLPVLYRKLCQLALEPSRGWTLGICANSWGLSHVNPDLHDTVYVVYTLVIVGSIKNARYI